MPLRSASPGRGFSHVAGALCTAVLCLAAWSLAARGSSVSTDTKPDTKPPVTAILLIARAELPDPFFEDAVVLVLNNLGPGPAGIILNRPTKITVSQLFPDDKRLASLHDKVYFGGPVDLRSVWFLVRATKAPARAIRACEGVYLSADRELLLQLLHRDKPMEGLRIFIGYAGWAVEQLQDEIGDGDWTVEHADSNAIFSGRSEHPWPGSRSSEPST